MSCPQLGTAGGARDRGLDAGVWDCAPKFNDAAISAIPKQDVFMNLTLHDGIRLLHGFARRAIVVESALP